MHVPQGAFHRRVDAPHGQRGADAHLAVGAVQRLPGEVLAPVAQLAQGVGNDLQRAELQGQVKLLPARTACALTVALLPGQMAEGIVGRIARRRRRGDVVDPVARRRVLEPNEVQRVVAKERLPQRVVVAPRQPRRLRDEIVGPRRGEDVPRSAVDVQACGAAPRRSSGPSTRPIRACSIPEGSCGR